MGHAQSALNSSVTSKKTTEQESNLYEASKSVSTKPPYPEKKIDLSSISNRKRFRRLGTIRKKLARTLRTAKNSDYRKQIRDLLQTWTLQEIKSFVKEYDGLEALKQLTKLSNAARYTSSCLSKDVGRIFTKNVCCDIIIEYKDQLFPVHKALLCQRCKLFDDFITKATPTDQGYYALNIPGLDISLNTFKILLAYIYSEQIPDLDFATTLKTLNQKFGELNPLHFDIKSLLLSENHADMKLVFENSSVSTAHAYIDKDGSIDNTLEVKCHTAILCARSNFFKSLLTEKIQLKNETKDLLHLKVSEKIIPRSYIRVLLHCFYTDSLDLSSIIKWKVADDGSGEADQLLTISELAMELYELGQFLEFSRLMQECENIIVENLNVSSLLGVLEWSSQPFGSSYVYRQALQHFQEEFYSLCKTPVFLANIPEKIFKEVLKSDFIQANEEFILATIIKWGEWQIARLNEKPGTSPANSLIRRSPKRKDINNEVLFEMISDLLQHVRVKHIIPANSSVLNAAYQRSLLQRPFPFDVVASEKRMPNMVFWLRECRHKDYKRPRLFTQYVYEVKLVLHEYLTENESGNSSSHHTQRLPDMLPLHRPITSYRCEPTKDQQDISTIDVLDILQLKTSLVKDMVLREKELKSSKEALKALSVAPDTAEISAEIQLRVVREFGLPDAVAWRIFQQAPDLIEDSGSSNSSKQSTLSKVGRILKHERLSREASLHDDSPLNKCIPSQDDILTQTRYILHNEKYSMDASYDNPLMNASSPVRSIEDSPLDLPFPDNSVLLPNVLLDT